MKFNYIVKSRAWYGDSTPNRDGVVEEIWITRAAAEKDGGSVWEFGLRLHEFTSGMHPTYSWRVEVFNDAWRAFTDFAAFFQWLSKKRKNPTLSEIEKALQRCGAEDKTQTESPYKPAEPPPMHHCSRCGLVEEVKT